MALSGLVKVCGEADGAEQAIRTAMHAQPDLCIVGTHAREDALTAVRGICRAAPDTAVVVLSEEHDVELLLESIRAGAVGYVPGALDAARLRRIVEAVAAGEAVIPRAMILELFFELRNGGAGAAGLSVRESQVLGLLRRGHSTAEIARRLEITPVTVRRHISALVRELGVANRAELLSALARRPLARRGFDTVSVRGAA